MATSHVYGVICDLMFGSQISQAVVSAGLRYRAMRSMADVQVQLSSTDPDPACTLWIVNLIAKSATEPELVDHALPLLLSGGAPVVCYAPHVEEQRMAWAQSIGAKIVVPRGALIRTLGGIFT